MLWTFVILDSVQLDEGEVMIGRIWISCLVRGFGKEGMSVRVEDEGMKTHWEVWTWHRRHNDGLRVERNATGLYNSPWPLKVPNMYCITSCII